ncbi:hypothetical protein ACS0TY_020982 [Phlomoides rotata]
MFRLRKRNLYLSYYNLFQAFGWALSLFRILSSFFSTKSTNDAFSSAGLLQSIAFLEVIHGAIGIVPSGFLLPLMQWGGRTHFLLAIVCRIHEVQELPAVFITFVAWALSEVIRYSHYALYSLDISANWMTFISVADVPSTSIHKEGEPLCGYSPFHLLLLCHGFAFLLSISMDETLPSFVQPTTL